MTSSDHLSRRNLLLGTAAVAMAAGVPLVASCKREEAQSAPTNSTPQNSAPQNSAPQNSAPPAGDSANVRVSNDGYGVHVEPSVAANPRHAGQLLAACQASPTADPEFIATYLSSDAGTTWRTGGLPQPPVGVSRAGDDVTVAFDGQGRGYVCATSNAGGRAVYVWRTDDGGRTFSAPVTLVSDQYCDHPWLATGTGPTAAERNVYAVWSSGNKSGLGFTRSTNGGVTFEEPRVILADEAGTPDLSSGPALAAGVNGLVCAACDRATRADPGREIASEVVVVCSTDGGRTFGAPITVGAEAPTIALPDNVQPVSSPTVAIAPDGQGMYVAFIRHQQGATHSDVMVTGSHDGGRTWSPAVSATPTDNVIYFQPNLTVDPAGRVAVSAFALTDGRVDVVLLVSAPGQLHFGAPQRVTTAAFDPAHSPTNAGKHGAWWIGDYQGIASSGGGVHLVWNDARTGKLELFAATLHP